MKLAVLGAGGGLGRAFLAQVPGHHDVGAFAHSDLDVGDHDAVIRTLVPAKPEAILNFAAFTKVDACEKDPETAIRSNALGPRNLALAARRCGALVLHVSTDYVFDGSKETPYDELDSIGPLSVYARSKLAGEEFVRRLLPESFVVRTGYVFGGGTDYLSSATRVLSGGGEAGGLSDRTGTPTFVRYLAARILPLVLSGRFGTYHIAGPEPTSWFEVLKRVKALGGLPGEVRAQTADELGLPALRPRNSSLSSLFSRDAGLEPMPDLDISLKEFLDGS
ncbi:MAG: NAD(P)-dependent oxidoreductase [Actinomycetota bacterium]